MNSNRGSCTRRSLFQRTLIGALVCYCRGEGAILRAASLGQQKRYDLLIRGGRVIDPAQDLSASRDVAILGHTIAKVATDIPEADARHVLDARGLIVTPGLIDIHIHVYDGVAPVGVPPDPNCIAKGVTTVVDAGSAGAHTFPGFRKYVIDVAQTRVRALLNISVVGQSTLSPDNLHGELLDLKYVNPGLAVRTIEQHRDLILGIKVRLTRNIAGENDLRALQLAREAADAVKLPIMVHIGGTPTRRSRTSSPSCARGTSSPTASTGVREAFSTRKGASCRKCSMLWTGECTWTSATVPAASRSTWPSGPSSRTCCPGRSRATSTSSTSTVPCSTWRRRCRSSSTWD